MKTLLPRPPFLVAMALLLSACGTFQSQAPSPVNWQQHRQSVQALNTWTLRGKLGIHSERLQESASLYWQQSGEQFHIQLNGPLGQGTVRLCGSSKSIQLERSNQPVISSDSPEELLMKELGWALPIAQIHYWVKGVPAPGEKARRQHLENGWLQRMEQSGWEIVFSRYHSVHLSDSEITLPGRIELQKNSIKLTLVIKQWQT